MTVQSQDVDSSDYLTPTLPDFDVDSDEDIVFYNPAVTDDTLKTFQIGYRLSGEIMTASIG